MPRFTEVENRILKKYISDPQLFDSLGLIRGVMESIWASDVPKIVQNYTDHGEEHSVRVAGFIEKLLQVNPNMKFSEQEIYLLLAGVYLHDIGMQCDVVKYPEVKQRAKELGAKFDVEFSTEITNDYSPEQKDKIRENHHFLSAAWIDYMYDENEPVLSSSIKSIPDYLVDDLIDICKFHSKLPINNCPDPVIQDSNIRKKMIAALLRFADELDISRTRVEFKTVQIFNLKPDNSVYWWLHSYTEIIFIDSNIIRLVVRLHPEDFKSYSSVVQEDYITKFKNKNQSVVNVLVGYKIPVVIDDNSHVMAHKRVKKFPPEIAAVFDKLIQNKGVGQKKPNKMEYKVKYIFQKNKLGQLVAQSLDEMNMFIIPIDIESKEVQKKMFKFFLDKAIRVTHWGKTIIEPTAGIRVNLYAFNTMIQSFADVDEHIALAITDYMVNNNIYVWKNESIVLIEEMNESTIDDLELIDKWIQFYEYCIDFLQNAHKECKEAIKIFHDKTSKLPNYLENESSFLKLIRIKIEYIEWFANYADIQIATIENAKALLELARSTDLKSLIDVINGIKEVIGIDSGCALLPDIDPSEITEKNLQEYAELLGTTLNDNDIADMIASAKEDMERISKDREDLEKRNNDKD
jgi:hypothetical protein